MRRIMLTALALIACLLPTKAALAVDFRITNYEMSVDVQEDGSALVTETQDYKFGGNYNGILSAFDVGDLDGGITDLSLFVDGDQQLSQVDVMLKQPFTYTQRLEGRLLNVRAYAPGYAGTRTFRYTYRMNGLCQRYLDAARLNYKLIGTANEATLENATIKIMLPGGIIDAWAHGAVRNADIQRDGNMLVIGPKNVNPGRFVEADILFDEASLSGVETRNQTIIQSTRELEASIARNARIGDILMKLLAVFLFALPLGCMVLVRRIGQHTGFKRTLRDRGDLDALNRVHAATAEWIYFNRVDTDGLTGTILELVAAGAVAMDRSKSEDEIHFVLKNRDVLGVTEAQNHVLSWLFPNYEPLTPDSLNADGDLDMIRAQKGHMQRFEALAKAEAEDMGFMSGRESKTFSIVGLCLLALAAAIGVFFVAPWWLGAIALIPMAGCIALAVKLRRLSDEGERVFEALNGLKLEQGLPDVPPPDVPRLAALCAALGCLTPFFNQVRQSEAWRDCDAGYYPYWMYDGWTRDVDHARNRMRSSWKANSDALSEASSSSDAGSGFSGGDSGGGGGGGGHGAW